MKSVAVVIELAEVDSDRLREAIRLCAGLLAGGIRVTTVARGDSVRLIAGAQPGDDLAAHLAMLAEAGGKVLCDVDEIGECKQHSAARDCLRPTGRDELMRAIELAEGRIVFGGSPDVRGA